MAADDEPSASKTLAGITLTDVRVHRGPGERRGSLLVIAGAHADLGAHLLVDGEVVIGRELGDLRLHDGRVSRRHVRVLFHVKCSIFELLMKLPWIISLALSQKHTGRTLSLKMSNDMMSCASLLDALGKLYPIQSL